MSDHSFEVASLDGFPEVVAGDDLGQLILEAGGPGSIRPGDLVVVAQKAVSKAEGAVVDLEDIEPSSFAKRIAEGGGKDPRLVEVILAQSRRIVKMDRGVLITETHHGFVCANAGVDASNVPGDNRVTVLPEDSDKSARRIRLTLEATSHGPVGVIVSDSFNRPWREGSVNVAIGVSGVNPLVDRRGEKDDAGRVMHSTIVSIADEVASAAQLVMGEAGGRPVAVVRGLPFQHSEAGSGRLIRAPSKDLFR